MPSISETILSNQNHPGDSTTQTVTGEKFKGDGYYGRSDGLHTVQYTVSGFEGSIDIQATLATTPTDDDYFTVASAQHISTFEDSSNAKDGSFIYNFTGNYVWIRAKVHTWTDGNVSSITLNH